MTQATVMTWSRIHLQTEAAPAVPYLLVLVETADGQRRLCVGEPNLELDIGQWVTIEPEPHDPTRWLLSSALPKDTSHEQGRRGD